MWWSTIDVTFNGENFDPDELLRITSKEDDKKETSVSTIMFDESCLHGWTKSSSSNLIYLKCQERYINELLKHRGFLFENDVRDILGAPRTIAGQFLGWVFNENYVGDKIQFETFDFGGGRILITLLNSDGDILKYL